MLYFMHMPRKFWKSAYAELSSICNFRIIESLWDNVIISAKPGILRSLNSEKNVFIYGAFEISSNSGIKEGHYEYSIYRMVRNQAAKAKGRRLIIDVYDVNSRSGHSSKDLEVIFGRRLESEGFSVNLDKPDALVYAVLFNWRCYSGIAEYSANSRKLLNPIRHYNLSRNHISRSEMKIAEAFDRFGLHQGGTAIDLGAAPGGWSGFLAKKGFNVIAVDSAAMSKEKLAAAGLRVAAPRKNAVHNAPSIIHYKMGFAEAYRRLKETRADLIVNDMNISPADSAKAVALYSDILKSSGACIMTLKSVTKYIPGHIASAEKALGKHMKMERIAVLPSNRQELTILCRKK